MGKRLYKIILITLLLITLTFTAFACNKEDEEGGEKPPVVTGLTIDEAVSKTCSAFANNVQPISDKDLFTLSCRIQLVINGISNDIDLTMSIDKLNPENTILYATSLSGDELTTIYYKDFMLYIDNVDGEKISIKNIDLTDLTTSAISYFLSDDFVFQMKSTLLTIKSSETDKYIEFNVAIRSLVNNLMDVIASELGGSDMLIEAFSLQGVTTEDVTTSTDQIMRIDIAGDTFDSISFSSQINGKKFMVALSNVVVTDTFDPIESMPSDFSDYTAYSFSTMSINGMLKYNYVGKSLDSLIGDLSDTSRLIKNFNADIPFSVNAIIDGNDLKEMYIKADIPGSILPSRMTSSVYMYYYQKSNEVYLDLSSVNMGRILIDLTSDKIQGAFIKEGTQGTLGDFVAIIMNEMKIQDDGSIIITLDSNVVNSIMEVAGLKSLLDIDEGQVKFTFTDKGIEDISGSINFASGNSLALTANKAVIGLGIASIPDSNLDKSLFKSLDDITNVTASTSGYFSMPNGRNGNDIINTALKQIIGAKLNVKGYDRIISYNLLLSFNLVDISDIQFVVDINGGANDTSKEDDLLLTYNRKNKSIVIMKSNADGLYSEIFAISEGQMADIHLFSTLVGCIDDLFGTESPSILEFLFSNGGIEKSAEILLNFLTAAFTSNSQTYTASSAIIEPNKSFQNTIVLSDRSQITGITNSFMIDLEKLVLKSNIVSYNEPFYVFGAMNGKQSIEAKYGTINSDFTSTKKLAVKYASVEYNQGQSGAGYINYEYNGIICRVFATNISSSEIESTQFIQGSSSMAQIVIDAKNTLSVDPYEYLIGITKAKIKLFGMSNPTEVDIEWITDLKELLAGVKSPTANNEISLTAEYKFVNNLGKEIVRETSIVIRNLGDFNKVNLILNQDFYAYGGVNPQLEASYPVYYDVTKNSAVTESDPELDGGKLFKLTWDLSNIVDLYRKSFNAYEGDVINGIASRVKTVTVGVTATNAFGYTKTYTTEVTIHGEALENVASDVTFDVDKNKSAGALRFARGITYDSTNKMLVIDPYKCTALTASMFEYIQYVEMDVIGADGVKTRREFPIMWELDSEGNLEVVYHNQDSISNAGGEGFIKYRVEDTIGGCQLLELPFKVIKKNITAWTLLSEGTERKISGIDKYSFSKDIKKALTKNAGLSNEYDGIYSMSIETEIGKIDFLNCTAKLSFNATINDSEKSCFINIDKTANTWILYVNEVESDRGSLDLLEFNIASLKSLKSKLVSFYDYYLEWEQIRSIDFEFDEDDIAVLFNDYIDVRMIPTDAQPTRISIYSTYSECTYSNISYKLMTNGNWYKYQDNALVASGASVGSSDTILLKMKDARIAWKNPTIKAHGHIGSEMMDIDVTFKRDFEKNISLAIDATDSYDFDEDANYNGSIKTIPVGGGFGIDAYYYGSGKITYSSGLTLYYDNKDGALGTMQNGVCVLSHSLTFDPYNGTDYTTIDGIYPKYISVLYNDGTKAAYEIEWDISGLLTRLESMGKNSYGGIGNAPVKAKIIYGVNKGVEYSQTYSFYVNILDGQVYIDPNSNTNLGYFPQPEEEFTTEFDAAIYQENSFGVQTLTPVFVDDSDLIINDPTDSANYPDYIGIKFDNLLKMNSRWMKVLSWNIDSITARFTDKSGKKYPINTVTIGENETFTVYATIGNDYSGTQVVPFNIKIDMTNIDQLRVDAFGSETILNLAGDQAACDEIECVKEGNTYATIYVNPYLIDVYDVINYPKSIKLSIGSTKTQLLDIKNWNLPTGLKKANYNGGEYTASVLLTCNIELPIKIVVKQMLIASTTTNGTDNIVQYNIEFNPFAINLDNSFVGATFSIIEDNGVKYISLNKPTVNFRFKDNGKIMNNLDVRFPLSDIPTDFLAGSNKQLENVYIGNKNGGWQTTDAITFNILASTKSIVSISHNDDVVFDNPDGTLSNKDAFIGLPDGSLMNVPETLPVSFAVKFGLGTSDATDVTAHHDNGNSNGYLYKWYDVNGNEINYINRNVYQIKFYKIIPELGITFDYDTIVIRQTIKDMFKLGDNILGLDEALKFQWNESFEYNMLSVGDSRDMAYIINAVLNSITANSGNYINNFIMNKYPDLSNINGFIKTYYKYDEASASWLEDWSDNVGDNNPHINEPGKYKVVYSLSTDDKYYGDAEFEFSVIKKDLYLINNDGANESAITFRKDRATELGADIGVEYTYNGLAIPFNVKFAANYATIAPYNYDSKCTLKINYYKVEGDEETLMSYPPVDVGTYRAKIIIEKIGTSEIHKLYTCSRVVDITIIPPILTDIEIELYDAFDPTYFIKSIKFTLKNGIATNLDGSDKYIIADDGSYMHDNYMYEDCTVVIDAKNEMVKFCPIGSEVSSFAPVYMAGVYTVKLMSGANIIDWTYPTEPTQQKLLIQLNLNFKGNSKVYDVTFAEENI